jgi:hypothetical protein
LSEQFRKVAGRLGGAKADLPSHIGVALQAIVVIWNRKDLSWVVKDASVGFLLENLCKERSLQEIHAILIRFDRLGRDVLNSDDFRRYLRNWSIGHFVGWPQL